MEAAVRAAAVFFKRIVRTGNYGDIFKCSSCICIRITYALIAVFGREQIRTGHSLGSGFYFFKTAAVKLCFLFVGVDIHPVIASAIDLQRAAVLEESARKGCFAEALAHDECSA